MDPKLLEGMVIQKFDDATGKMYLMIYGERKYRISSLIADVFRLKQEAATDAEIACALQLSEERVREILNTYSARIEADSKETRSSFLFLKFRLLKVKRLTRVLRVLSGLYASGVFVPLFLVGAAASVTLIALGFSMGYLSLNIYRMIRTLTPLVVILLTVAQYLEGFFHELGHVSALHHFGYSAREIGVGVYFSNLVLYSDVDDTWRLARRDRLVVDLGGIYYQCVVNLAVLVLFLAVQDHAVRSFIQYFAFLNTIRIVSNLLPFMKFDGYWIVVDIWGIPKLHEKIVGLLPGLRSERNLKQELEVIAQTKGRASARFLVVYVALYLAMIALFCVLLGETVFEYLRAFPSMIRIILFDDERLRYLFQFLFSSFVVVGVGKRVAKAVKSVHKRRAGRTAC